MPVGKLVFAQLMDCLPLHTFRRCVARYPSSVTSGLNFTQNHRFEFATGVAAGAVE